MFPKRDYKCPQWVGQLGRALSQGGGFRPQTGHIQESTNECIKSGTKKSMFLSLSLSLYLFFYFLHSKNQSINKKEYKVHFS